MKPTYSPSRQTHYDIYVAGDNSRILETTSDLPDAFIYCQAQTGLELLIRDRRRVCKNGKHGHKQWRICPDGTVAAEFEDS